MKTALRWVKRTILAVLALAVVALGVIYLLSARVMNPTYDRAAHAVSVPTDPVSIEEGRRLAATRGCFGCHGDDFAGEVMFDPGFPMNVLMARLTAPDLTRLADERTDAELERGIRGGVRPDGRSVMVMPSEMFQGMSDEELGLIIAAIRAAPPGTGLESTAYFGPMARFFLVMGDFYTAASRVDHERRPPATTPTDPVELGRYLATAACSECHGEDLLGQPGNPGMAARPALSKVMAYTSEQFGTLMREGLPLDGRELDLMDEVAVGRFAHFTEHELQVLYGYLSNAATWEGAGQ